MKLFRVLFGFGTLALLVLAYPKSLFKASNSGV